jgi:hypothetical protein
MQVTATLAVAFKHKLFFVEGRDVLGVSLALFSGNKNLPGNRMQKRSHDRSGA